MYVHEVVVFLPITVSIGEYIINMKQTLRKVCMLGDFSVGKTSLVRRFVEDRFDDQYKSTIGVKISRRTIKRTDEQVNIMLWDLAGGDDYNHVTSGYLKGASGIIMVCDLTRKVSMDAYTIYSRQLKELSLDPPIVFIGNKCDLVEDIEITDDMLARKSAELGVSYIKTSAKTGEGVENAFNLLLDEIDTNLKAT